MALEFTPDPITSLSDNEVFVFGSSLNGLHNSGAARVARDLFGAVPGCGVGMQGQSYAIPTMGYGIEEIKSYVDEFTKFALSHPQLKFYVTRIGCGSAGFTDNQIAPLFDKSFDLPNVVLPESFWEVIHHQRQLASETSGMKFHFIPFKFYDEDIAKMETMSQEEKVQYALQLRKEGKYLVAHESPQVESGEYVFNTTLKGRHIIAISERSFAIIAGTKLYSNLYPWGLDLGQRILSAVAKDNCAQDYPYGQFVVLLEDGSIKEIWSDSCVRTLGNENDKEFCSIASGCNGLIFGLRKNGTVAVLYPEKCPQIAEEVVSWSNIKQIDASPEHVVGLKDDSTVVACGKTSACQPLESWKDISKIYVSKMAPMFGKINALTFGISDYGNWLQVDGDTWPKGKEFWKRIRAQYYVTDVIENAYCVWVRTYDHITRAITYYSPMNYQEELNFVNKYPSFRYYDAYGDIHVLVDKDGEFHVLKSFKEVPWWQV